MVVIAPLRALGAIKLRPKPQRMDLMRKGVASFNWRVEVIVQVMDVHISIGEGAAWRDLEVAHHFVYPDDALDAAALLALGVESLAVAFSFALLDALAAAECPAVGGV